MAHLARRYTRHILAAILVAAAVFHVQFAAQGDAGAGWIAAELASVAVFGALAVAGVRGSPSWLVAGWALHPVWDIPLHLFGPGHAFAPESYAIACLNWDCLTAGYLAYRSVRDWNTTTPQRIPSARAA